MWRWEDVGLWFTLRRSSSMSSYTLGKTISMWNMLKQPRNIWSSTLSLWNYIRFFKNLLCQRVVAQISLNYLPEARPSDPVSNQNIGEKSLELQCSNALLPAHARICQLPTIPNEGVDWKRLGSNWLVGQWSLFTFFPTSGLSPFPSWVYMIWFEGWFQGFHPLAWGAPEHFHTTKTSKP